MYLEELTVVDDSTDDLIHVVGVVGALGDDAVQGVLHAVDGVGALHAGSLFHVVAGHVTQQLADDGDSLFLGLGGKVCHTALAGMYTSTTQLLLGHVLAGDGLNHLGAGQEHEGDTLGHDDEVGQGRGVNGTTGTRTKDCADLGNNTRCVDVALENLGIASQSVNALLDAGATRVVQADNRSTLLHGQIHHLTHLQCHGLTQRTANDGCILSKHIHQTATDGTETGYNAVTVIGLLLHAEVGAAVLNKHVQFLETALVKEHVDALTGSEFALLVLLGNSLLATAQACFLATLDQLLDLIKLFSHVDWS